MSSWTTAALAVEGSAGSQLPRALQLSSSGVSRWRTWVGRILEAWRRAIEVSFGAA